MTNSATVLRIAQKFVSPHSIYSIARVGDLKLTVVIVSVLYFCLVMSLLPFRGKFEGKRRIISNLSIQFSIPETLKVVQVDKIVAPPRITALTRSNLGVRAVDKPLPGTPVKPVETRTTANPNNNQPNSSAPRPVAQDIVTKPAAIPEIQTTPTAKLPVTVSDINPQGPTTSGPTGNGEVGNGEKNNGTGGLNSPNGNQAGNGGGGGNGNGALGQQIAMLPPKAANANIAMGNIAPYRKDMLMRLAANWHPKKRQGNIVLVITLTPEGKLINSEILTGSGDEELDKYTLETVEKTGFAPLPDWYKGRQLRLKIELARVEAIKNEI